MTTKINKCCFCTKKAEIIIEAHGKNIWVCEDCSFDEEIEHNIINNDFKSCKCNQGLVINNNCSFNCT